MHIATEKSKGEKKFKLAVEEAETKYKQLVAESALVDESQRAAIRSSQLNFQQSKLELQRSENNVQRMTIKAPMDGIVVMGNIVLNGELRQIREGDQVAAGQPFMSIVDPSSMVLNATVNQVDAERLFTDDSDSIEPLQPAWRTENTSAWREFQSALAAAPRAPQSGHDHHLPVRKRLLNKIRQLLRLA